MGHRGEDASRTQAGRGGQPPWQDDDYPGPGRAEQGPYDEYGDPQDGYRPGDAYGTGGYDTSGYDTSGYGQGDEYGTGPRPSPRDPVRGYPPASGPTGYGQPAGTPPPGLPIPIPIPAPQPGSGPMAGRRTGPQIIPHTGQQVRYDGHDPRPGPGPGDLGDFGGYPPAGGYAGRVSDAFDGPAGYRAGPAAGRRDGFADYPSVADSYADRAGRPGRSGTGGPAGPSRPSRTGPPRGRRPLLLAAIGVVGVVIIGILAYVFLLRSDSPASTPAAAGPLPSQGATASTQACVQKYGTYCHIELSTDDPTPLTVAELFPPAFTNDADKNSFSLVSTKLDKTCSKAVIGADLIKALKAGKCTQVVRASYVSGNGKIMGTIGVANLDTTNQAHYAGKVVGQSDFVTPLAAAKGVARKLGQGTGVVEAEFKGHYLILTWSEFVDGTKPSTKAEDSQLEQFSKDLVAGTANISLSQRMVTGAAPTPAAS